MTLNSDNALDVIRQTNLNDIKDAQTLRSLLKSIQTIPLDDINGGIPRANLLRKGAPIRFRRTYKNGSVDWNRGRFEGTYREREATVRYIGPNSSSSLLRPVFYATVLHQIPIEDVWCRGDSAIYLQTEESGYFTPK